MRRYSGRGPGRGPGLHAAAAAAHALTIIAAALLIAAIQSSYHPIVATYHFVHSTSSGPTYWQYGNPSVSVSYSIYADQTSTATRSDGRVTTITFSTASSLYTPTPVSVSTLTYTLTSLAVSHISQYTTTFLTKELQSHYRRASGATSASAPSAESPPQKSPPQKSPPQESPPPLYPAHSRAPTPPTHSGTLSPTPLIAVGPYPASIGQFSTINAPGASSQTVSPAKRIRPAPFLEKWLLAVAIVAMVMAVAAILVAWLFARGKRHHDRALVETKDRKDALDGSTSATSGGDARVDAGGDENGPECGHRVYAAVTTTAATAAIATAILALAPAAILADAARKFQILSLGYTLFSLNNADTYGYQYDGEITACRHNDGLESSGSRSFLPGVRAEDCPAGWGAYVPDGEWRRNEHRCSVN